LSKERKTKVFTFLRDKYRLQIIIKNIGKLLCLQNISIFTRDCGAINLLNSTSFHPPPLIISIETIGTSLEPVVLNGFSKADLGVMNVTHKLPFLCSWWGLDVKIKWAEKVEKPWDKLHFLTKFTAKAFVFSYLASLTFKLCLNPSPFCPKSQLSCFVAISSSVPQHLCSNYLPKKLFFPFKFIIKF